MMRLQAVVSESLAAIVWLDETYDSGTPLMPTPRAPPRATVQGLEPRSIPSHVLQLTPGCTPCQMNVARR